MAVLFDENDNYVGDAQPAASTAEPSRPSPTNARAKLMAEQARGPVAAEIEPSTAKRVLAGAGRALATKWAGLTGQPAPGGEELTNDSAGRFGALLPDVVGSIAAPARIVPQMLYGAVSGAAEPGTPMERTVAGLKGAAGAGTGQALASGVVKGTNTALGNLTREGQVAAAAGQNGLDLTAGDILKNRALQLAEEKSFRSPSAGQGEQVSKLMTEATGDPITNAIRNAYDSAQGRVSAAATKLDDIIANNPGMPKVQPRNMYSAVREISARSPDTLNNVRDPQIKAVLDSIAAQPANQIPRSMTFQQLDELRKVLGPVMSKVEQQSMSGASNVNTADANRWKQLYKAIMTDIEGWGSSKATADALAAHKELSNTFKNEVLPLREHPVAGKVIDDGYARPEDLLRDLTSVRNKSIISDLYNRLDQGGKNAFDALRMSARGSREFVRGEGSSGSAWSRPLALLGAAGAGSTAGMWAPHAAAVLPWAAAGLAGEQALVHGLNSRLGKAIASGTAEAAQNPLANAAVYSALRSGLPYGGLEAVRQSRQQLFPQE